MIAVYSVLDRKWKIYFYCSLTVSGWRDTKGSCAAPYNNKITIQEIDKHINYHLNYPKLYEISVMDVKNWKRFKLNNAEEFI